MAGKIVPRWLFAAVLVALPILVHANPSPLTAEVQPLTMRPRTQAPALLNLKLRSQSRAPLEGTLDLEAWSDDSLVFRQQIPDLTVTYGESNQRLLLPPPPPNVGAVDEVRLRFSTHAGTHDLGRFPVATAWTGARQYLIGVCRPDPAISAKPSQTRQALRPERPCRSGERPRLLRRPGCPGGFPTPPGLCAFDVVLEGRHSPRWVLGNWTISRGLGRGRRQRVRRRAGGLGCRPSHVLESACWFPNYVDATRAKSRWHHGTFAVRREVLGQRSLFLQTSRAGTVRRRLCPPPAISRSNPDGPASRNSWRASIRRPESKSGTHRENDRSIRCWRAARSRNSWPTCPPPHA